jgi:hypothetical protein
VVSARAPAKAVSREAVMTRFQLFVKTSRDEHAKDPRVPIHEILNTIPYWAVSQPAELLWQRSKNRAGSTWYECRNMPGLLAHWCAALYGGTVRSAKTTDASKDGATATFKAMGPATMKSLIAIALKEVQLFLDEQEGQPKLLGQVAPAGVPLAVSPAGAGLRRITLYQLSRLWANALAV